MRKYKRYGKSADPLSSASRGGGRAGNRILSAIGNQAIQSSLGEHGIARSSPPHSHQGLESAADDFARAPAVGQSPEREDTSMPAAVDKLPGGRPLEKNLQEKFAPQLGGSLDQVRIHDDADAHAAANSLNARAFTHGNHIVFAEDYYRPRSTGGERLLAHELMHVAQQRQSSTPALMRDGGLWELEEEQPRQDSRCRNSLNWSDGGHWIGSGPEPDCSRAMPPQTDACRDRSNWSDGGHWIGSGPEPDCSDTGTPGVAMQQSLQRASDAYWARWERNRQRVLDTRDESTTDAEALASMFRAPMEDDGSAEGRLQTILGQTRHWLIPGLQTGIEFGDSGFSSEYQDAAIWPSSGNQVGHFLTAVRLGYDPSFLDSPLQRYILDSDEDVETMALRLIVGHEQEADPGIFGALASLIPLPGRWGFEEQYHSASDEDIENFRTGNLEDIDLGTGRGNSMQDLALSYQGYRLGRLIAEGELTTPEEIADWIEREVGATEE